MEKLFIKNRDNKKIAVLAEVPKDPQGLVFIMHGLDSNKNFPLTEQIASSFRKNNYIIIRFDFRNTNGESEGFLENATITNYYQDLEDVINWTQQQSWYQEPFYLVGHSLGGLCATLYTQNNFQKIKALAPISVVVSGELLFKAWGEAYDVNVWRKNGNIEWESSAMPGLINKVKFQSFFDDSLKYDLIPRINKLNLPILMIAGDQDETTPIKHQKILFNKLPDKKEFHIIKGATHTFRGELYLQQVGEIFDKWIKTLN